MPAYFVRVAGCNQMCSFCDSKSAWSQGSTYADCADLNRFAEAVCEKMSQAGCRDLIITGGEPLIYSKNELPLFIDRVSHMAPYTTIHMETSGYSGNPAWAPMNEKAYQNLCVHLSPKIDYNLPESFWIQKATEIRFPVSSDEDLKKVKNWISCHKDLFDKNPVIYLSPIIKPDESIDSLPSNSAFFRLVDFIKNETGYRFRLSVQQHKWWNIR